MDAKQIREWDDKYVLHTYGRAPFVFDRGQGTRLTDTDGKVYLDFVSGIAVNALGYGDEEVCSAIAEQAHKVIHTSNLYLTAPQAQLAKLLVEHSFADKVFFCNSGAESVEAAIKFSRKYARVHSGPERIEFIAMSGAFHGRTMGALALTPRDHYQDPFLPLMPGARIGTFNDLDSVKALASGKTCAIIVEPVQGEGGVNPADPAFIQGLRTLCDEIGALLIFDEVQCGLGRTGTLWAHEPYGVAPDLMTLAKPVAGGLPMGVTFLTDKVAAVIEPGDHASTFAGGAVVAAAGVKVVERIAAPEFLAHVRAMGARLEAGLLKMQARYSSISQVRGRGLLWGIQCDRPVKPALDAALAQGLLLINAGPNVVRLIPPLVVDEADIDLALAVLDQAFAEAMQ
ncbi:MAG: aspartate aminotransferase family protein [Anaerolineae bacterium]|jgi:acetylornithine/N-succinyldiaminopimelate aminotransferase